MAYRFSRPMLPMTLRAWVPQVVDRLIYTGEGQ
jgi:hypothetical protein